MATLVEGKKGEVQALPLLIRRIAQEIDPTLYVQIPRPVWVKRNQVVLAPSELERAVSLACTQVQAPFGIFALFDADEDDPNVIGPSLWSQIQVCRPDVPSAVVLAKHEYENWFIAAAESLRRVRGLPDDLSAPDDPEGIQGAKEWIRKHQPRTRKYQPSTDQAALTAQFDMETARQRSPSFDFCYREIERLIRELTAEEDSTESPPDEETS